MNNKVSHDEQLLQRLKYLLAHPELLKVTPEEQRKAMNNSPEEFDSDEDTFFSTCVEPVGSRYGYDY